MSSEILATSALPGLITLTGADEYTDLDQLQNLVKSNPALEVGLLYTTTAEGRVRYPSRAWLERAVALLSGRVALHVCGGGARRELLAGDLADLTRHTPRVQVNGRVAIDELPLLASRVGTVITQHADYNLGLVDVQVSNHSLLIDGSGGRGISPAEWPHLETIKPVGFAGGLGPDNLAQELVRIGGACAPGSWIDMEGKLRLMDKFSLHLAAQCLDQFRQIRAISGA